MTIPLSVAAFCIVAWYLFRGEIGGRGRIVLFALAAASLGWLGSWAARAWDPLGTGADVVGRVADAAERTGVITLVGTWLS